MRAANSHFGKHYINGVWTTPKGAMIDVENPATREIFARVPDGTPEEVDAAVAAAQSALPPLAQYAACQAHRTDGRDAQAFLRKNGRRH